MRSDPYGFETKLITILAKNGFSVVTTPTKSSDGVTYALHFTYLGHRDIVQNYITSFTAKLYDQGTGKIFNTFELDSGASENRVLGYFSTEFSNAVPKGTK